MDTSQVKSLLNQHKLKATPSRLALYHYVHDFGSAVPYSNIQDEFKDLDRVTLYRTLNAMCDKGLMHRASVGDDEVHYAVCAHSCTTTEHHHDHVHFKCDDCERLYCVPTKGLSTIELDGYEVREIQIQLSGVCKGCRG